MKCKSHKKKRLVFMAAVIIAVAVIAGFGVFAAGDKPVDYSQIVGQWVRASGGYVLDIQNVQPDGKLHAVYLNPRPINISKARANESGASSLQT